MERYEGRRERGEGGKGGERGRGEKGDRGERRDGEMQRRIFPPSFLSSSLLVLMLL